MKPELLVLRTALDANIPTILWGPPGIGKTSHVEKEAKIRGWRLETVLASIRQPDDFLGLPHVVADGVHMIPPDWARRLAELEVGVLFLDEVSCTTPATQSALLRVFLERVVGDLALPPAIRVVAAANPPSPSSGGYDLSRQLSNRALHIHWRPPSPKEWSVWAMSPQSGLDPTGASLVSSFLLRRADLMLVEEEGETTTPAWPSPRSWAMVGAVMSALAPTNPDPHALLLAVEGCVGNAAALEFLSWYVDREQLEDPEQLLKDPEAWVPAGDRPDVLYMTAQAVVAAVREDMTAARWNAAWQILWRVHTAAPDMGLALGADLARAKGRRAGLHYPDWLHELDSTIDRIGGE